MTKHLVSSTPSQKWPGHPGSNNWPFTSDLDGRTSVAPRNTARSRNQLAHNLSGQDPRIRIRASIRCRVSRVPLGISTQLNPTFLQWLDRIRFHGHFHHEVACQVPRPYGSCAPQGMHDTTSSGSLADMFAGRHRLTGLSLPGWQRHKRLSQPRNRHSCSGFLLLS